MVRNRKRYFLAGMVLLLVAVGSLVWGIAGDAVAGLLLFAFILVAALFAILLPVMAGLYIKDYDASGRVRTSVAGWREIAMTLVGAAMVAIQVNGLLRDGADRLGIAMLVTGALIFLLGLGGFISVWRRRNDT